jgi:hypothetical protein
MVQASSLLKKKLLVRPTVIWALDNLASNSKFILSCRRCWLPQAALLYPRRISCGLLFPFTRGEPLARVAARLLGSNRESFKWERIAIRLQCMLIRCDQVSVRLNTHNEVSWLKGCLDLGYSSPNYVMLVLHVHVINKFSFVSSRQVRCAHDVLRHLWL